MSKTVKINETFVCIHCKKVVPLAEKTCRNHCPYCFCSLHVDEKLPGDRKSLCQGKMFPKLLDTKNGVIRILFRCEKCGKTHWNKRATDDEILALFEYIERGSKGLKLGG